MRTNLGLNKTASWVTFLYFVQPYSLTIMGITSSSSIVPSIAMYESHWGTSLQDLDLETDKLHLSALYKSWYDLIVHQGLGSSDRDLIVVSTFAKRALSAAANCWGGPEVLEANDHIMGVEEYKHM